MRIAFLNLCHTDPEMVTRVANKLTADADFDMYIHVDKKSEIEGFKKDLQKNPQVFFLDNRVPVYWGGFNAIEATYNLINAGLDSKRDYDYYVLLQNLDYPIKSNAEIKKFFTENKGKEFIRGCNIARTRDTHYMKKYRLYYEKDTPFYQENTSKVKKYLRYIYLGMRSIPKLFFNGVIHDQNKKYEIHYGAAQWAVTKECAKYFVEFRNQQKDYDKVMSNIQFPDEEYFHTIVHNSKFKEKCIKYNEPLQRWLVNWRNIHYFEFPRSVTVMEKKDYERIMKQDVLFVRKVKTGISDDLVDLIDKVS